MREEKKKAMHTAGLRLYFIDFVWIDNILHQERIAFKSIDIFINNCYKKNNNYYRFNLSWQVEPLS